MNKRKWDFYIVAFEKALKKKYSVPPNPECALGGKLNKIAYGNLKKIFSGEYVPSDELLAILLHEAGMVHTEIVTGVFSLLEKTRKKCEFQLDHKGRVCRLESSQAGFSRDEKEKLLLGKKSSKQKWYAFNAITKKYRISPGKLMSIIKACDEFTADSIRYVEMRPPMRNKAFVSAGIIESLLKKRELVEIVKAPKGWMCLGELRKKFTDSSITMDRRIDDALQHLRAQNVPDSELVIVALNRKRNFTEFYSPKVVEAIDAQNLHAARNGRLALPLMPEGYVTFSYCRNTVGGDFNSIKKCLMDYCNALPAVESKAVFADARAANGVVVKLVALEVFERAVADGLFSRQQSYLQCPEPPKGWLSSGGLAKIYMGNRGKMTKAMEGFMGSLLAAGGPLEAEKYIREFRHNGKISLFISPDALKRLESGKIKLVRRTAGRGEQIATDVQGRIGSPRHTSSSLAKLAFS